MACTFDPKQLAGQSIGMFHCPACGQMVIAGIDHPNYDELYGSEEKELEEEKEHKER